MSVRIERGCDAGVAQPSLDLLRLGALGGLVRAGQFPTATDALNLAMSRAAHKCPPVAVCKLVLPPMPTARLRCDDRNERQGGVRS